MALNLFKEEENIYAEPDENKIKEPTESIELKGYAEINQTGREVANEYSTISRDTAPNFPSSKKTYFTLTQKIRNKASKESVRCLAALLMLFPLSLVGALVVACSSWMKTSELEQKLEKQAQQLQVQTGNLSELRDMVDRDARRDVEDLIREIQSVKRAQVFSTDLLNATIKSSIDALAMANTPLNLYEDLIREIQSVKRIQVLSMDLLNATIKSSIINALANTSLYEGCIQDTASCTMDGETYWRYCWTSPRLPATQNGYYTTDMQCKYSGVAHFESALLRETSDGVFVCDCDTIYLSKSSASANRQMSSSTSGTCTLVITRCPTTLTLGG